MNPVLKAIAKAAIHKGGILEACRYRSRSGVRILMYHRFPATTTIDLRRQCEHIRRHYSPVSLRQVAQYYHESVPLPRNALAVTIDDGYRDFIFNAYPIFLEFSIPVTIYLVSGFLDGEDWLWWNKVEFLIDAAERTTKEIPIGGLSPLLVSLESPTQRDAAVSAICEALKELPNSARLQFFAELPGKLGVELPCHPPEKFAAMTWDQARAIQNRGVEFGAHTRTHPILSSLADSVSLEVEIEGSKKTIERELQTGIVHFCYPNGRSRDISPAAISMVRSSKFLTATTTERGINYSDTEPVLLKRLAVEPDIPEQYFAELLAGVRVS